MRGAILRSSTHTARSIRVQLDSAGTPIGGNDLIIASQAMTLDLTLVTDNERGLSQVGAA